MVEPRRFVQFVAETTNVGVALVVGKYDDDIWPVGGASDGGIRKNACEYTKRREENWFDFDDHGAICRLMLAIEKRRMHDCRAFVDYITLLRLPIHLRVSTMSTNMTYRLLGFVAFALLFTTNLAAKEPLKVFILAGQSNMQGHAEISTFDHVGMDPKTAPLLRDMTNAKGEPKVCDNVWISSIGNGGDEEHYHGQLTAGYGAKGRGTKIGPEFTFGIYMQKHVGEPILIIKTAWGGKSLHTDFRPPSAGPYELNESQLESLKRQGKDIKEAAEQRAETSGKYYREMKEHVHSVLKDIKSVYPEYDEDAGYKLSGFVWFQGWNDMVGRDVYPNRDKPGGYDLYSKLMAQFIRDVRKEFKAPNLPFVIGVMGVNGPTAKYGPDQMRYKSVHQNFRDAMAAPAAMKEFKGNVTAVLTENYWDAELGELKKRGGQIRAKSQELNKDESLTRQQRADALEKFRAELYTAQEQKILTGSSNAEYHYNGSAKIMAQIGKAFAEANADMMKKE